MENNEFNNNQQNNQQPQQPYAQPYQQPYGGQPYQQPYQQPYAQPYQQVDPEYEQKAGEFLRQAIISLVLTSFPVASIIAIFKAKKNRQNILDYLAQGGMHTPKIKTCSCLSRAAIYLGIGTTVIYGIYMLYLVCVFFFIIVAAIGSNF